MFMYNNNQSVDFWAQPAREMFNFWISFSPMAPFFGVEWRFSEASAQFTDEVAAKSREAADKVIEVTETLVESTSDTVGTMIARTAEIEDAAVDACAKTTAKTTAEADVAAVETVEAVEEVVEEAVDVADTSVPEGLLAKAPGDADDLTEINGVGPALARKLNGLGVYRFSQIAGFSETDLVWLDENLGGVKGRCFRDNWVGQAKARLA